MHLDHGGSILVVLACNMIRLLFMQIQASIDFHKLNGYVEMKQNTNLFQNAKCALMTKTSKM